MAVKVNTQTLKDTAQEIRNINESLDSKLEEIRKGMNNLNSTWKSDSATAITDAINNLASTSFVEYKNTVDSYAKFLDGAAESWETTETSIEANANQFK